MYIVIVETSGGVEEDGKGGCRGLLAIDVVCVSCDLSNAHCMEMVTIKINSAVQVYWKQLCTPIVMLCVWAVVDDGAGFLLSVLC